MSQTVIGFFDNATEAQKAVEQLASMGISRENIDVSSQGLSSNESKAENDMDESSTTGSNSMSTGNNYSGAFRGNFDTNETTTMNADYDDNGNRKKESGIGKFFRNLFGNEDEANTYSKVAMRSGSIVTVHANSSEQAEDAADILDECGAVDVDERAKKYGYTNENDLSNTGNESTTSIPVIKEEMQVGKRTVETGGKRLRSRIIEKPVEENLRLREETVRVERNTVDRPATDADLANFQESDIEIIEHAEIPVVSKEARVVEEISLGKDVNERKKTVRDTVRSTEVEVEDINKDEVKSK